MSNCVLARFDIRENTVAGGFYVRKVDLDTGTQLNVEEDVLGEIQDASAGSVRDEIVIETTVDDARRIRQLPGVCHVSQRKVNDAGRVRLTVDIPEHILQEVTSRSNIWARSSMRVNSGIL